MNDFTRDDVYYVCTMIEYTARKTKNHRGYLVSQLGIDGIRKQLKYASTNHSLSFEQVADEWIEDFSIEEGDFDTASECKYELPSETSIGKVYLNLIENCGKDISLEEKIYQVFSSFISDAISDFNSNIYYSNPEYLLSSYEEGKLLA
ncbi:MAG: hypothetical protein VZQ80_09610 [Lachnospiraceae bacterium]|nr:hypothetical protein [Lachnospiraceae bacterium]